MSLEAFRIEGKNALVTGSRRGLGAAIALALAEAGANVACHGREPKEASVCEEIRALGRRSVYFSGDVADERTCAALVEKTVAAFGTIDILVNNAGVIRRAWAKRCHVISKIIGIRRQRIPTETQSCKRRQGVTTATKNDHPPGRVHLSASAMCLESHFVAKSAQPEASRLRNQKVI